MLGFGRRSYARRARVQNSVRFTPPDLPGCVLWCRSDLGVTRVSGAVSVWADQSGQHNNLTQVTAGQRPTYNASDAAYNGRPTLSFASASTQLLNLSVGVFPAQPFTAYVVGESTSGATQQEFFGDSTNNVTMYFNGANFALFAGVGIASSNTTRSKQAFAGVFNSTTSALYINTSGVAAASGNNGASNPGGGESIGGQAGASPSPLNGKIAEIIVFNVAHTAAQVSQMFKYLGPLYGGAWS